MFRIGFVWFLVFNFPKCCCFCLWVRVLSSLGWPQTYYVAKDDLEIFIVSMGVHLCIGICSGDQKRTSTTLELELQIFLSSPMHVLGQELKSSERTVLPLKHWIFSPSLSWTFDPSSVPKCWHFRHVPSILVYIVLRINSGLPNTEPQHTAILFFNGWFEIKSQSSLTLPGLFFTDKGLTFFKCAPHRIICVHPDKAPCSQV